MPNGKMIPPQVIEERRRIKEENRPPKDPKHQKMGKKSKRKGYAGEKEVESILPGAERDFGRGARGDVRWGKLKVEVKRRKSGFKEIYSWLKIPEGSGREVKQGEDHADLLLIRSDNMPWLMVIPIDSKSPFRDMVKEELD